MPAHAIPMISRAMVNRVEPRMKRWPVRGSMEAVCRRVCECTTLHRQPPNISNTFDSSPAKFLQIHIIGRAFIAKYSQSELFLEKCVSQVSIMRCPLTPQCGYSRRTLRVRVATGRGCGCRPPRGGQG